MGVIIGPRGFSLKRMEGELGVKVMIRGKGTVKEGKHSGVAGDNQVRFQASRIVI
jgi:hypothetical protein